jgi:hypothetical protein
MPSKIEFFNHPEYDAKKEKWETYRDLYQGDHATLINYRYLWPHEYELATDSFITNPETQAKEPTGQRIRTIRARRSRYLNVTEPVVSNLIAMAFQKPIIADEEMKTMLGDDIKNIDGKGTSLDSFIKAAMAVPYFRDGNPIIQVDAPKNEARSRGEEQAIGFRPFLEVLDVLSVPDWQFAEVGPRTGKYDIVRYEYSVIAPRASMTEKPKEVKYCRVTSLEEGEVIVRIYQRDEEKKDWVLTEKRPLDLPELPVVTITTNESWIKDVSELQLVVFNLMSAYYNQLNTQAFQRIMVAGLDNDSAIAISEYAISRIPLEARPFIIEPSSMSAHMDAAAMTIEQIAKVAFNRTRSLASDSKEAPGADTIAEMNAELMALLRQALEEMESLINSALKIYAMYKLGPEKGAAFTGRVEFSKELDVKAVSERIELFLTYRDEIRKVLPWRKAELKRVAAEMGYDDEDLTEITAGIEALKDEPMINPLMGMSPFMAKKEDDGTNEEGETDQEEAKPGSEEADNATGSTGR